MKKLTNLLCAACLAVTGTLAAMPAPLTASAALAPVWTSGKAGENVTWNYDISTHTLTFSGTGDMYKNSERITAETSREVYRIEDEFSPQKIVIEEGITGIGCCSVPHWYYHDDEEALVTVSIPGSVTDIYKGAFSGFNITSIVIPASVSSIGDSAFCCSKLRSITIENPDCVIAPDSDTICNEFVEGQNSGSYQYYGVIIGAKGSTAEAYAKKYGRQFAVIGTEGELAPMKPSVRGDYNGDNMISVEDAQNVLLAYAETLAGNVPILNALQKNTCDVNKDGSVDITDAQYILIYYTECSLLNPDAKGTEFASSDGNWVDILNGKPLR